MKIRAISYFLFLLMTVFVLNVCLPAFAAENADTYDDAPLLDKQTAESELLFFEDNSYNFKDIVKHWARDEMLELSYMDIMLRKQL